MWSEMAQDIGQRGCGMACASGKTGLVGATIAVTIAAALGVTPPVTAQSGSAAETAARLTGHWKLNAELTPVSAKPGRGGGRSSFAVASAPVQRGGGGHGGGRGGGGDAGEASAPLTAEESAAQTALSILHQVAMEMTIEATVETITVREPRGEWRFTIDGKNTAMDVPGGMLHSKSRWDHSALRQEFSSAQRKLVKIWSVDANDRLVLTERYESIAVNSESRAVFDRQAP
jgi:hypothetical protein